MASTLLVSSSSVANTPTLFAEGGAILGLGPSGVGLITRSFSASASQRYSSLLHPVSGGWADQNEAGGVPTPQAWSQDLLLPSWAAGQTYPADTLVTDGTTPGNSVYSKTSPGPITSATPPSADAVNWTLTSAVPTGPRLRGSYWTPFRSKMGGSVPLGMDFMIEDGPAQCMTLTGRSRDGTTLADAVLRVNGLTEMEGLRINNTFHAVDPSIGKATIAVGAPSVVITTKAADTTSYILLTATSLPGAPGGCVPVVTAKTANDFTVSALDPTTGAAAAVAGANLDFDWLIVNPLW